MAIIRHVLEYSVAEVRDGVIEGVKIVGLKSRNGYRYCEGALLKAIPLYENAPVYVLHPEGQHLRHGSRKMNEHLGSLQNVRMGNGGLFGDLHMRQSHCMAGTIASSAKTKDGSGRNFGMSHNVQVLMNEDETEVTKIVAVNSVDLVDNPATTTNLFEEEDMDLTELVAASEANTTQIKSLEKGQGEIKALLEGLAAPSAGPKTDRISMLEEVTDPNAEPTPTFGHSREDFAAGLRGISRRILQ